MSAFCSSSSRESARSIESSRKGAIGDRNSCEKGVSAQRSLIERGATRRRRRGRQRPINPRSRSVLLPSLAFYPPARANRERGSIPHSLVELVAQRSASEVDKAKTFPRRFGSSDFIFLRFSLDLNLSSLDLSTSQLSPPPSPRPPPTPSRSPRRPRPAPASAADRCPPPRRGPRKFRSFFPLLRRRRRPLAHSLSHLFFPSLFVSFPFSASQMHT